MIDLRQGDCLEIMKEIKDNSIDLVVTDPPYIVGTIGAGLFGNKSDEYSGERYVMKEISSMSNGFSEEILDELCRVMKKINIYIWCSQKQIQKLLDYFVAKKKCNFNIITWHKTNPIPACGNKYLNDTELCLFFREKGVRLYGNFNTKRTFYVTTQNAKDKKKYKHPTIKPLDIIENFIVNSSKENDTVLDCFMGSGTTGVACKNLNRNFIGIELDEKYFKIAKDRIGS